MGKKEDLKQRMQGGMESLIRSTVKDDDAGENSRNTVPTGEEKEKEVHCNFVMPKGLHKKLKMVAAQKDVKLKTVLQEALEGYFKEEGV
ncbi:hypothetical protein Barb6_01035 [Bacteroidales bacterium Barb6]|nr:hypothetical protein Barb6_01035 [Bacteroidales bacterium Barb6]